MMQAMKQAKQDIYEILQGERIYQFYGLLTLNPKIDFYELLQAFYYNPNITIVKTFDDWHSEASRWITKGIPIVDSDQPYKRKHFFDISQTYGFKTYKATESLSDTQLLDAIKSQSYIHNDVVGTFRDKLHYAIVDYVNNNYDISPHQQNAVIDGVLASVVKRYNKSQDFVQVGSSQNLDYNNVVATIQQVYEISKNLFEQITEYRRQKLERKQSQVVSKQPTTKQYETNTITQPEPQQAFPNLDKIRTNVATTPPNKLSNDIPRTIAQQEVMEFSTEQSKEVGEIENDNDSTTTIQEPTPQPILPSQFASTETNRDDGRGDGSNGDILNERLGNEIDLGKDKQYVELDNNIVDANNNSNVVDTNSNKVTVAQNYQLTDVDFANKGGLKSKYKYNIEAIRLVKQLQSTKTQATYAQQQILARYSGWGGIPQAFDNLNQDWATEYTELKSLLTESEYTQARSSTLTSFYTSKTIIDGIYNGLSHMGVSNVSILEPAMGTGNFIGLLPENFKRVNDFYPSICGVELDPITGAIAKQLYPNANIQVKGFEETTFPNDSFDCAVSNVPFGNYGVYDKEYSQHNLNIHDYFILKSLDKVRMGGIVAVVTTKGTLDKSNDSVRKLIADKAKLLGAIRLPNNAFKDTANTKVTSDILFFQKVDFATAKNQNQDWLQSLENSDGVMLNQYFQHYPEMVLGTMKKGKSMYGGEDETYCKPDGRELGVALEQAIQHLPKDIYLHKWEMGSVPISNELSANDSNLIILQKETKELDTLLQNTKNYCYNVSNDESKIYLRIDNQMVEQDIPQTQRAKLIAMIYMREQVRIVLNVQLDNCSDEWLKHQQEILFGMYHRFTTKYGYLNAKKNKNIFRNDGDCSLLLSLENYDESTNKATRTDIFNKRTIRKYTRPTSADNCLDALKICKNETGRVDIRIIEQLTNKTYEQVITDLDGQIYRNPTAIVNTTNNLSNNEIQDQYTGWETVSEYLAGNVVQKLSIAKILAKQDSCFEKNVQALQTVQPIPLTASEISVRLGVGWISPTIYKQFIVEKFKLSYWVAENLQLDFNPYIQSWKLKAPSAMKFCFENTNLYGTSRLGGNAIFEYAINLQTPNVYDTIKDYEGKDKRILNKPETIAAREKLRKLQEEFKAWVFDEPTRREQLVATYNEKFNNTVLANYDGSYLDFPEMNPQYELKPHQKDAVERIITNGNTLLHHTVGAGKTFEIIASAMKLRQMKLANKPMIVVPNHLVLQWSQSFRELYPQANLLVATEKDFEKENRLKFVSRIATGNWDSVIMAMSSFEKIPISQERQKRKINEEIQNIKQTLDDIRNGNDNNPISIKSIEKILKNKQERLKELNDSKKDSLINFEDLGIDYLFVDEAHNYKNRFLYSKMNNVAGITQTSSKRATDLDMKIDYLNELHNGQKGVVFATGTPTSNSMVEMYTMQSYLAKDDLQQAGLHIFDNWAATFGETVTGLELAPSGKGYRSRTRFAKFTNLPELLTMYRKFADVKTQDMLNLPVPKANKHTITIKPTDTILELTEVIAERAENINNGGVPPEVDNMLKVTSDGKKLALDPRCFDKLSPDDPNHKVNIAAENIYHIWENTKSKLGTQLVFCDLSTPKVDFENYNPEKDFDVYNHLKTMLVKQGIPQNEIAYIHEAKTSLAKQSLFDNVNAGKIRILIGSTQKCGAGTNVQTRLVALHHLDAPWRPADLEQREGRAIRQGNTNAEVDIYTYVTQRTFDSYSYQILENKQRFISQINRGELTLREAQDIDETTLSYAEIKAITSANPLIKRKQEVENELSNLKVLETQYRNNRYRLQDRVAKELPQLIVNLTNRIANFEKDLILRDENRVDNFAMTIANQNYTERKDGVELLHQYILSPKNADKVVAHYKGFDIIPEVVTNFTDRTIILKGNAEHKVTISESPSGTLTRIDNAIDGMDKQLQSLKERLVEYNNELATAKVELTKPFEHSTILNNLSAELESINAQLNLDKSEIDVVIDDTQFASETNVDNQELDENTEQPPAMTRYIEREQTVDYTMG
jgi:N12 class adenine-specific DNA methylase/ribosome-associated translation inhibitor RaiA